MLSIRLDKDVRSLSEFRARVAEFVHQVRLTGRPLLLTQHGRAVAIIMDVRDFEVLRARLESLEQATAEEAAAGGRSGEDSGLPRSSGRADASDLRTT